MRNVALRGLDIIYWLAFFIYISGGLIAHGRHHFGAIQEVFRVVATLSLIALFSGVDLLETSFVKGWVDFARCLDKRRTPQTVAGSIVTGGTIFLLFLFFLAPLMRHWNFGTWAWDLGALSNIVWRGAHGYGFTSHIQGPPGVPARDFIQRTHLLIYLYPISLIYKMFPFVETLIFLQSLAMISCMIPLYLLAKRLFPQNISPVLLPLFYWCFETAHHVNMWDVHENGFIPFFALWAIYFFVVEKYWRCGIFTLCVALFKEDAWVIAGAMGCFFLFSKRQKTLGVIALFVGFFVFVYYSVTQVQNITVGDRYSYLGATFAEAKTTMLTRPWVLLVQLGWHSNYLFYLQMALVSGGLWLLGGWSLIMVAPVFFEIVLSTYDSARNPDNHYIYPMAGSLFFSAALGMRRLGGYLKGERLKETVTALTLICLMQLKYSEAATIQSIVHSDSWKNRQCLSRLAGEIPKGAAVYGRDPFFTHLSNRPVIWEEMSLSAYPEKKGWSIRPVDEDVPSNYEIVKQDCGFKVLKAKGI